MSLFEDKRVELQKERKNVAHLQNQLYTSREKEKILRAKIANRLKKEGIYYLEDDDPDQIALNELQEGMYKDQILPLEVALPRLEEAEREFDKLGSHGAHVEELDNNAPVLLMPVRLQTRLVNVKHIIEGVPSNMLVDISQYGKEDFDKFNLQHASPEKDLVFIPTYFGIKNQGGNNNKVADQIARLIRKQEGALPGIWFKIVPDSQELWIRIYPDDIFVHGHEELLSPDEIEAGKRFWERWCEIHKSDPDALDEELGRARDPKDKPLTASWAELQKSYSHARASWIAQATRPSNLPVTGSKYPNNFKPNFEDVEDRVKSACFGPNPAKLRLA
ncbi:MAG: hypothetical protein R3B47_00950 [Bacteroidia bacterium]